MPRPRKIAHVLPDCVACGSCIKPCPVGAISVYKGMRAIVDRTKCVGCGKCATVCPAGVIAMMEKEAESA